MRRRPVLLLSLLFFAAIATPASADDGWEPKSRWYGGQTIEVLLVADGAIGAGAALAVGHAPEVGGPLIAAGVITHLIGPPLVHLVHHHNAGASWFLNIGMPFIVAAFTLPAVLSAHDGGCRGDCNEAFNPVAIPIAGLAGAGALVAMNVVDIAALSTLPRRGEEQRATFGVMPLVGDRRTGLAVGGTF